MSRNLDSILVILAVFTCTLASGAPACATESTIPYAKELQYQTIDRDFTHFSTDFFHSLTGPEQSHDYRSFNLIVAEARHAYTRHEPEYAISLIISHDKLVKANINSTAIIETEALLLKANEFNTAKRYLQLIENQSDPSIIANVLYAFAEYNYARDRWSKTIATVQKIANDLPPRQYQHAMLMQGISLQNQRKHRKALAVYQKIPATSPDYVAARINMAVANIRQGWWTDAYEILNKLLQRPNVRRNQALVDRLHTVIGYTFLQQEYYRNSRNAFRKVELKGPYTNQALLGIALDAGYQKDYVGALNAARILQHKHSRELQVDEANLLLPYFYEKLGQMATASAGYTDAIKYYEGRLQALQSTISSNQDYFKLLASNGDTTIHVDQEEIDLGDALPPAFFQQLSLLKAYRRDIAKIGNRSLSLRYHKLRDEFNKLIDNVVKNDLKQKVQYITDYMNQCRYGQARLYDKNLSDAK